MDKTLNDGINKNGGLYKNKKRKNIWGTSEEQFNTMRFKSASFLQKLGLRLSKTDTKEHLKSGDEYIMERRELLHDLDETLSELRYARNCFENARDPDIIEACVYEIKSAEARYSYLLRKAKESGINQNCCIR